jgi:hypothetical protein
MAEEPNEAIDTKMEYFKKLIIGKFFFWMEYFGIECAEIPEG